jgi:hypothetical protein
VRVVGLDLLGGRVGEGGVVSAIVPVFVIFDIIVLSAASAIVIRYCRYGSRSGSRSNSMRTRTKDTPVTSLDTVHVACRKCTTSLPLSIAK